jgi:hypothetical protein
VLIFLKVIFSGLFGYLIGRFSDNYLNLWMKDPWWTPHHWIYGPILAIAGIFLLDDNWGLLIFSFGIGLWVSDFKDYLDLKFFGSDNKRDINSRYILESDKRNDTTSIKKIAQEPRRDLIKVTRSSTRTEPRSVNKLFSITAPRTSQSIKTRPILKTYTINTIPRITTNPFMSLIPSGNKKLSNKGKKKNKFKKSKRRKLEKGEQFVIPDLRSVNIYESRTLKESQAPRLTPLIRKQFDAVQQGYGQTVYTEQQRKNKKARISICWRFSSIRRILACLYR